MATTDQWSPSERAAKAVLAPGEQRRADELLRTQPTAVDFFNAMIERYPNHLGRTVLWVGARTLYGAREHPEEDFGKTVVAAWLEP
jgi:hypothetical protein